MTMPVVALSMFPSVAKSLFDEAPSRFAGELRFQHEIKAEDLPWIA